MTTIHHREWDGQIGIDGDRPARITQIVFAKKYKNELQIWK